MARDPRYDILFEPVTIGPKVMKNRFYQAPHASGFSGDLYPRSEARFREIKAEGGWAVVNTSGLSVHPEYDCWGGGEKHSRLWDDNDVRNWSLTCDAVHKYGALAGAELIAIGGSSGFDSRLPARAVSGTIHDTFWTGSTYVMDKDDIRDLQRSYVKTAKLALSAGFDIINLATMQGATVPLMFLMNYFNKRNDEYGGSFENRARFALETLEQLREAVGDSCAITVRFAADTLHGTDQGIRVDEEGIAFIDLADHLVDFWDLQVGGETASYWPKDTGPSRFYKENFQGEWIKRVRPHTLKPIVTVGRLTNPDTMVDLVRSGKVDIIGAARTSISDPFMPRKIEEGKLDEIRECIGCNVCVSRFNAGGRIICTQNATAGEEYRRGWHPERFNLVKQSDRNVLIVGAGVAGLECAIVLAKRGIQQIHLVEARNEIGGHLNWVTHLPGLAEWRRLLDYRKVQLDKQPKIKIIMGTKLDTQDVLGYGSDVVILATGSHWATDGNNRIDRAPIPGARSELPYVFTPEQIMLNEKPVMGDNVLVYDVEGYFMGASIAEKLARDGHKVHLVTPFPSMSPYMDLTGENLNMVPLMHKLGIDMVTSHLLRSIQEGKVIGFWGVAPDVPVDWVVDSVVLVTSRVPDDNLYHELISDPGSLFQVGIKGVYRVGDCVAPRMCVADAVFDAHRLAQEIDTDNPEEPLPFFRERVQL
jgi:dimethylamine/trimethylamine dehydrogenase